MLDKKKSGKMPKVFLKPDYFNCFFSIISISQNSCKNVIFVQNGTCGGKKKSLSQDWCSPKAWEGETAVML